MERSGEPARPLPYSLLAAALPLAPTGRLGGRSGMLPAREEGGAPRATRRMIEARMELEFGLGSNMDLSLDLSKLRA